MAGKIITIAQQKGGSGKTTLAANLALAFAASGKPTAILDTDPQGSLGRWFMSRAERMGDNGPGLGFRTASAWGARYEARELLKTHDYVVIDTPPKMGVDGRPAIEAADLVIIPVTPSPIDIWATEPTIEMALTERKPVLLVMNRASSRARLTGEMREVMGKLGGEIANTMIANRIIFAGAMSHGHGVLEKQPSGLAAAEIRALSAEIAALLD
ncbi:MAG: ParA family partition ATPase [Nitratireductor sp.]